MNVGIAKVFDNFFFLPGSILKKLLHTGNSFKVSGVFNATRYEKSPPSSCRMHRNTNVNVNGQNLATKWVTFSFKEGFHIFLCQQDC